jgi:hypothetical protein
MEDVSDFGGLLAGLSVIAAVSLAILDIYQIIVDLNLAVF